MYFVRTISVTDKNEMKFVFEFIQEQAKWTLSFVSLCSGISSYFYKHP